MARYRTDPLVYTFVYLTQKKKKGRHLTGFNFMTIIGSTFWKWVGKAYRDMKLFYDLFLQGYEGMAPKSHPRETIRWRENDNNCNIRLKILSWKLCSTTTTHNHNHVWLGYCTQFHLSSSKLLSTYCFPTTCHALCWSKTDEKTWTFHVKGTRGGKAAFTCTAVISRSIVFHCRQLHDAAVN